MSSLGAGSYKATLVMSLSWARLPQLLSVYLLMFFLGHFTRYSPRYFSLYYSRWTGEMLFTGTSGCRITRWTLLFVQDLLCKSIPGRERSRQRIGMATITVRSSSLNCGIDMCAAGANCMGVS